MNRYLLICSIALGSLCAENLASPDATTNNCSCKSGKQSDCLKQCQADCKCNGDCNSNMEKAITFESIEPSATQPQ